MDSLNKANEEARARENDKVPLFLICPNDAFTCLAIHLSFSDMICWHTECRFGAHTKGALCYSTILSFFIDHVQWWRWMRSLSLSYFNSRSILKKHTKSSYFIWNRLCVCSRTFEHIRRDKTNSCQQRFSFSVWYARTQIEHIHTISEKRDERLFNLFSVLLFDLSCDTVLVSQFAQKNPLSLSPFFRTVKQENGAKNNAKEMEWKVNESEKTTKTSCLFCYLMEKTRYFTFSNEISTIFLAPMELCLIAISISTEWCRTCSHTNTRNRLNVCFKSLVKYLHWLLLGG